MRAYAADAVSIQTADWRSRDSLVQLARNSLKSGVSVLRDARGNHGPKTWHAPSLECPASHEGGPGMVLPSRPRARQCLGKSRTSAAHLGTLEIPEHELF